MEYKNLGNSGLQVSVLGFGAWGVGGAPFWSNEGDEVSSRAMLKAYEMGINFFDTAPVYGFGHSEELIGKTLKPFRDKIIYATKCGLVWDKEELGAIKHLASRDSILAEVELSLQRLQTDWIDLYQVHWPDDETTQQETMEALLSLKTSGKIRHIGVSNYSVAQMTEIMKFGDIVSLQPDYSLLNRKIEKEIVPYCLQHNIGIVAYSPLASGVLTGKYNKNTQFKDWRGKGIIGTFKGEGYYKNIDKVEALKKVAKRAGKTCTQMAIHWIVNQPAMATALLGFKNESQVEENLSALGWKMDPIDANQIDLIFKDE